MKNTEEIEYLKRQWRRDPCWDIEETEGFEDHKEELKAFRLQHEEESQRKWNEELMQKSKEIGVEGNLVLAAYIMHLESTIKKIQHKLDYE